MKGDVKMIQRLYDNGADLGVEDYDKRTPLHIVLSLYTLPSPFPLTCTYLGRCRKPSGNREAFAFLWPLFHST